MGKAGWLALGLVICIIIFGVLIYVVRTRTVMDGSPDIENLVEESRQRTSWGTPTDVPNGSRNVCSLYTFNSPTEPTLDSSVLDGLSPSVNTEGACVDVDQIIAKQQIRQCLGNGDTGNICVNDNGDVFQQGQSEVLYVPCDVDRCKDTLGSIAFDSSPIPNSLICMESLLGNIIGNNCTQSIESQLFRIERAEALSLAESSSGVYARIQDRETGLCVVPNIPNPVAGTSLTIGECTPNSGYVWFLVPEFSINGVDVPQQIVYTSSIAEAPTASEMSTYISNNNPLSLVSDGVQSITLQPFATSTVGNEGHKTQILDSSIYVSMLQSEIGGNSIPYYDFST